MRPAPRRSRKSISARTRAEMLSLAGVCAGYGSLRALFDVSLDVKEREAVGVIGPNGAGKTTLMRVISGLIPLSQGEMTFDGVSLPGLPAHRIVTHGIAHIPENRRLFPRLTVEENLRIGAFIPQARRHFADRLAWGYDFFPRLNERPILPRSIPSKLRTELAAVGGLR